MRQLEQTGGTITSSAPVSAPGPHLTQHIALVVNCYTVTLLYDIIAGHRPTHAVSGTYIVTRRLPSLNYHRGYQADVSLRNH
ncbi:hypothetical protein VTK56DRAFT_1139 [Thermocarpiscus australiensis]